MYQYISISYIICIAVTIAVPPPEPTGTATQVQLHLFHAQLSRVDAAKLARIRMRMVQVMLAGMEEIVMLILLVLRGLNWFEVVFFS